MGRVSFVVTAALFIVTALSSGEDGPERKSSSISFSNDVFPIIQKHCLPCHAEENFNPSELSLDTYPLMMAGGKGGKPFVPGKANESLIIRKLGEKPPDGERMPLNPKEKVREGKGVWLTDEEVRTIAGWIDQGGKDN